MPVIRTQDAIATYKTGDLVHVFGTDPGMKQDIPAWCRINGHQVLDIIDGNDEIEIIIKVGETE
jgi:tRNA 2-thiouridine synthesizing protein A